MYAVVRSYAGPGAKELFDMLEERKEEVESLIRPVAGLVSYAMLRTSDGGATVTVCQDKAGTEESTRIAREWVQENAAGLGMDPPTISEGNVVVSLT
jgi:hypothetical protein